MSLLLYSFEESGGKRRFSFPQDVELSGNNGPIARFVRSLLNPPLPEVLKWNASEMDLKKKLDACKGKEQKRAIVIDLKPRDKKSAHLYLLKEVWGYSDQSWTPVMLRLEELSVEQRGSLSETKESFAVHEYSTVPVLEFLYLNGGTKKSGWSWGPNGSVNGALLWPDVFNFFVSKAPRYPLKT